MHTLIINSNVTGAREIDITITKIRPLRDVRRAARRADTPVIRVSARPLAHSLPRKRVEIFTTTITGLALRLLLRVLAL